MKKLAWVCGNKSDGYTLIIESAAVDFESLRGAYFRKYRAAQDVANAINAHYKKAAAK